MFEIPSAVLHILEILEHLREGHQVPEECWVSVQVLQQLEGSHLGLLGEFGLLDNFNRDEVCKMGEAVAHQAGNRLDELVIHVEIDQNRQRVLHLDVVVFNVPGGFLNFSRTVYPEQLTALR